VRQSAGRTLVSDELARRGERLLERRTKQAQFRDSQKTLDNFDFTFNKEDESQPGLRSGDRRLHRPARRRLVSRSARSGDILLHLANSLKVRAFALSRFELVEHSPGS